VVTTKTLNLINGGHQPVGVFTSNPKAKEVRFHLQAPGGGGGDVDIRAVDGGGTIEASGTISSIKRRQWAIGFGTDSDDRKGFTVRRVMLDTPLFDSNQSE
jgi:hypothetical protein